MPDRIAILPGGRIIFIEVKRPGLSDGLSVRQKKVIATLEGARLYCMAYIRYGRLEREVTWSIDLIFIRNMRNNLFLDNPEAGLLLDMGMGKTVVSLTAADKLLNDYFAVRKVLVIAPLKPAKETWLPEIKKWDHLQYLTASLVIGSKQSRVAAFRARRRYLYYKS